MCLHFCSIPPFWEYNFTCWYISKVVFFYVCAYEVDRYLGWKSWPALHLQKMILVLQHFKLQTFLLLFSIKLASLALFILSFWRENSSLCVPVSQMSHSTKPVTMFGLTFWVWVAVATLLRFQRVTPIQVSHPHSRAGSLLFDPLFHSSLFFSSQWGG